MSQESQDGRSIYNVQAEQIRARVGQIERRQWSLWTTTILVTLLLTLGIASFAFRGLLKQAQPSGSFYFDQALRGLVALVLLFDVYVIYQQVQIHRVQRQLADQMVTLGAVEVQTAEVYKLAMLDSLTGLHNRLSGQQRLREEVLRGHRHGYPMTVLTLDLNDLKYINDRFGHAAGDELIKNFSYRLKKAIRGSDVAARLGGDEFLVLLPECRPGEVERVLDRLAGMKMDFKREIIPITFASGWADYVPGEAPEELLKRADDAMYINKRDWKDQSSKREKSL